MILFLTLLAKLIPLYILIGLGYVASRYLGVKKEPVARLLIYILSPVIVFHGTVTSVLTLGMLLLPLLFFTLGCIFCLLFYALSSSLWHDNTRNILGYTAGTGNTGYFGIPVALALFSNTVLPVMVLAGMGFILYENSLGFFITARGHHTIKESLQKLFRLPTVYAFIGGIILNYIHLPLPAIYITTVDSFRGAYTILGMMIIGLAMADMKGLKTDWVFLGIAFFSKFVVWPVTVLLLILLDNLILHLWDAQTHAIMLLLSIVPLAANTVVWATELNAQPQKAALAVLSSTLFALFFIPVMAMLFI